MERIKILYVDDEQYNLTAFVAYFRKHSHFEIFTALSGEDGMMVLKNHPIHVILSDQKMPNMTGIEFLQKAKSNFSEPIRIIVTAHRDISLLEEAKNAGEIFDFHDKPWDLKYLEDLIIKAYLAYNVNAIKTNLSIFGKLVLETLIEERRKLHSIVLCWEKEESFTSFINSLKQSIADLDNEIMKRIRNNPELTVDEI